MENGLVRSRWYLGLLCLAVSSQAQCKSINEWAEDSNSSFEKISQAESLPDKIEARAIVLREIQNLLGELDTQGAWQNVAVVEAILFEILQKADNDEDSYKLVVNLPFQEALVQGQVVDKPNLLRKMLERIQNIALNDESSSSSDSSSTSSDDSEASFDLASLTSVDVSDDISDLVASLGGFEDAQAINLGETVDLMQAVNGRIQQIRAEDFEDVSRVAASEVYDALLDLQKIFKNHATNVAVVELIHQILVGKDYDSDLDSNIRNKIEALMAYFDYETEYFARIVNTQARQYIPLEPPVPAVLQERPYQKGVQVQVDAPLVNRRPMVAFQADDGIDPFFGLDGLDGSEL